MKTVAPDLELVDGDAVAAHVVAPAQLDRVDARAPPPPDRAAPRSRTAAARCRARAWDRTPACWCTPASTGTDRRPSHTGAREQLPRVVRGHQPKARVRTAVEDRLGVHRPQLPVACRTRYAIVHPHRVTAAVRVEHFLARVEDLDGPPGQHGPAWPRRTRGRTARSSLRTPRPRRLDHPDPVRRVLEHLGQLAVQVVRDLRRRPHRQQPVRLDMRHRAVGLDRRVRRALEEVLRLDHQLRSLQLPRHVAELEQHLLRQVALLRVRVDSGCHGRPAPPRGRTAEAAAPSRSRSQRTPRSPCPRPPPPPRPRRPRRAAPCRPRVRSRPGSTG